MKLLDPHHGLHEAMQQKNAVKREAQRQAEAIHEKLRRLGHEIPKFDFLELIGKGAYGRVFKWYVWCFPPMPTAFLLRTWRRFLLDLLSSYCREERGTLEALALVRRARASL